MLWAMRLMDYIGGKKFVYSDKLRHCNYIFLLSENLSFFIPFIYAELVFLFQFSTVCFLSDSVLSSLFSIYVKGLKP